MAQYPNLSIGGFTAATIQAFAPDIYVKQTNGPSRTSTTTQTNDAELAGIALAIGTYKVDVLLFAVGTTGDLSTSWGFTGTMSGIRRCYGPGPATELQSRTDAPMQLTGFQLASVCSYGLNDATTPAVIQESSYNVNVTVAGSFAVRWSQQTSDATATSIQAGSAVEIRRIG